MPIKKMWRKSGNESSTEKDATMRHTTGAKKEDEKHKEKNTEKTNNEFWLWFVHLYTKYVYIVCVVRLLLLFSPFPFRIAFVGFCVSATRL